MENSNNDVSTAPIGPWPTTAPMGADEAPVSATDDDTRRGFYVKTVPKPIWKGDTLLASFAQHLGADVTTSLDTSKAYNPHRLAEFVRFLMRSAGATRIVQDLKKIEEYDPIDLICLFPSNTEVAAFRDLLPRLKVEGYRKEFRGTDEARNRSLYETELSQGRVFFGGDMLYYYSPGELMGMFADHPRIKEGLILYAACRNFSSEPGSLFLDRYHFPSRAGGNIQFKVKTTVREPVLRKDGQPKKVWENNDLGKQYWVALNRWKQLGSKGTAPERPAEKIVYRETHKWEVQTVPVLETGAIDLIEGHGSVDQNGILTYFASTSPGDSQYVHEVKSEPYFTHSVMGITQNGKHYELQIHFEWSCCTMNLLRLFFREVDAPVQSVTYDRKSPCYVKGGVIPTLFSPLRMKARGMDLTDPNAIQTLVEFGQRQLVQQLGKANYERLTEYHDLLLVALDRTVNDAVALSRVRLGAFPVDGTYVQVALNHSAADVVARTGLPQAVAEAYVRLTKRQTRAEFFVEVIRIIMDVGRWAGTKVKGLWQTISDKLKLLTKGKLNLLEHAFNLSKRFIDVPKEIRRFLAKLNGTLGWLRNQILKTMTWASSYPKAVRVFEESLSFMWCFAVALGEEAIKRAGPWWVPVLMVVVEQLFVSLDFVLSEEVGTSEIIEHFFGAFARGLAHGLLLAMPYPVAVLLHALHNYSLTKPWFARVMEELRMEEWKQTLDVELGDVAPRVPHTQPANMVEQSKIYTLGPDGTKHYIKDDDQFLHETAIPADSLKVITIESDTKKLLVKPTGTFLDMVVIEVARLNKPLPYKAQPAAWADAQLIMDELFVQPLKEEKGVFRALTPDQLITYIYQRPWTEAHKEETVDQIRKWKTGQQLAKPVKVTPKKDEIIPNQPTLAADGGVATKTRPITPKADADVPGMAVAVPLKYYVGGTRMWAVSGSDPTFMPTKEPIPGVFTFSTTYVPNPRSDSLGEWITKHCQIWGLHIIMHGDDHYALYVCKQGQWRACAIDMVSCDLTCAELFQRAFMWFVNELSDHSTDDIMTLQFKNLTGRFELKHNDSRVKERMFIDKEEPTTNTGEGLTSLKAWFGQQSAGFSIVKVCWVDGEFDPRRYKSAVQQVWRQLGFIPEFEEDQKGNVWHDVSACTFLGGFFVPQVLQGSQRFYWCPNKVLKSYFIFPDVNAIYGDHYPLQKHMLVLTTDPDMDISPVTREIKSWYKRCAQTAFGDKYWDVYSEALKRFTSYYRHFDPYLAEQWQQKKGLVVTPLSDLSFYPAADRLCVRNGWAPGRGAGELQSLVGEIQKFGTSPFEKLTHSAMALYVMRFGPPKTDPNSAEEHKPLSVLDAMGALALKIFRTFMRPKGLPRKEWNAMSAKQKAKMAARFLDFNIHTTSVSSGSQQYGAGLKLTGNSGGDSHSAGGSPMTTKLS